MHRLDLKLVDDELAAIKDLVRRLRDKEIELEARPADLKLHLAALVNALAFLEPELFKPSN